MPLNYVGGVSRYSANIDVRTISYWIAYLREHQEGGGTFHEKLFNRYFRVNPELCKNKNDQIAHYDQETGIWSFSDSESPGLESVDVGGMLVMVFCACVVRLLAPTPSDAPRLWT